VSLDEIWRFGVNLQVFQWRYRDFNESPFRFLHLGITQFRKGSWLVPEAFVRAFRRDERVELIIATHHEDNKMLARLVDEYGSHPHIFFVVSRHKDPTRHYDGAHVFVSPHLAEGWGLCIPEAMALGIPCIVSRCSAPREYFSSKFGWWCEMSDLYAPVSGCLAATTGFWRLPDVGDLAEKMRYAYEHRDECEEKGERASKYVLENLTWELGVERALG